MGFRLVPNSVTLNDLEWRNRPNGYVILLNSLAFLADCVKMVEYTRILSAAKNVDQKNLVFSDISLTALLAGDYPYRERLSEALPSRQRKLDHNLETVPDRR